MKHGALNALSRIMKGKVAYSFPMSRITSFRIGGPAWAVAHPGDENELAAAMSFCHKAGVPCVIIGNGTNLLVLDGGLEAAVIRVSPGMISIRIVEESSPYVELEVGAGAPLRKLLGFALTRRLSGLEFLVSIPGSTGGAVATNAGAFERSMADVITKVRLVNEKGELFYLSGKDIGFSYRQARLPESSAISAVFFRLVAGDEGHIRRTMREHAKQRMKTQPLRYPSAGSVFKNPSGDFAGRLIEAVGLKGYRCGDAQISEVHANFIVNRGHASAAEVLCLMQEARRRVKQLTGVDLEPEIQVLGTQG